MMEQRQDKVLPTESRLIHPEVIYKMLVTLFGSTGMRLSIMGTDGRSISPNEKRVEFCDYVQCTPGLEETCYECTRRASRIVRQTRKPYSYRCHMGLAATILPLLLDDELIAFIVFSGYRMEPDVMERLPAPVPVIDLKHEQPQLYERYEDNVYFSEERIREIIKIVQVTANYLAKVSAHTEMLLELQNKSLELLTTANIQEQREKKIHQIKLRDLTYRMWDEFLFDAIDQISIVAREENAFRTTHLLQDLSLHARKGRQAGVITTLGQEIMDLDSHIHLIQSMYGDRIKFTTRIDPNYDPEQEIHQIPFATLTDLMLRGPLGDMAQGGRLEISLFQYPDWVEVSLSDNSPGFSAQQVKRINRLQFDGKEKEMRSLAHLIAELRSYFGNGFSWKFASEPGVKTTITLHFPIHEVFEA